MNWLRGGSYGQDLRDKIFAAINHAQLLSPSKLTASLLYILIRALWFYPYGMAVQYVAERNLDQLPDGKTGAGHHHGKRRTPPRLSA
jgi:hypothetical protein